VCVGGGDRFNYPIILFLQGGGLGGAELTDDLTDCEYEYGCVGLTVCAYVCSSVGMTG